MALRKYGWKKSEHDHRDLKYANHIRQMGLSTPLPESVDLRSIFPEVYDQKSVGSCTANAVAAIFQYLQIQEQLPDFVPSRLFIYYNERVFDGTPVTEDGGSQVKTGIQVVVKLGVPNEVLWPYDVTKFADKPPSSVYEAGSHIKLHKYMKVDNTNLTELMTALANGHPLAFGFTVYEALESQQVAKTGMLPMPSGFEQPIGGHAVCCVGWKKINGKLYFIIRNSWGKDWGDKGYFYMPQEYITNANLADDFWAMIPITID